MGVEGINAVRRVLAILRKKYQNCSAVTGYTQSYALAVHESVGMVLKGQPRPSPRKGFYWDPQGQAYAKYLERPARENSTLIGDIARKAVMAGFSFEQGLVMGALFLQRISQLHVPVEMGALKASAFTATEKKADAAARAAFTASESIRNSTP